MSESVRVEGARSSSGATRARWSLVGRMSRSCNEAAPASRIETAVCRIRPLVARTSKTRSFT
jgi:hypothetical protein